MNESSHRLPDFEGCSVTWVRSPRRRSLQIRLLSARHVQIRTPYRTSEKRVRAWLHQQREWIREQLQADVQWIDASQDNNSLSKRTYRDEVKACVVALLARFPHALTRAPSRITIRTQATLWGSCSASGALSINLACSLLPPELQEYVVAHELCHLVHLNHSARFWDLLETVLPDALDRRARLQGYRIAVHP